MDRERTKRPSRWFPRRAIDFRSVTRGTPRHWHNGNVFTTLLFDAHSITFPAGEEFFVRSVRAFRDRIDDPDLEARVKTFVAQEAMHGRAHAELNALLEAEGIDPGGRAEKTVRYFLENVLGRLPPIVQLAFTVGAEHGTATLAHEILSRNDAYFGGTGEKERALWAWHALEELEHRAVAFDVFEAVGGTYPLRATVFAVSIASYVVIFTATETAMLAREGRLFDRRVWHDGFDFLFREPGLFRRISPAIRAYFARSFHPDDVDADALVAKYRAELFEPGAALAGTREFWPSEAAAI